MSITWLHLVNLWRLSVYLTLKLKIQPDAVAQEKLWEVSSRCTEL